jgi:beta-galactosidase
VAEGLVRYVRGGGVLLTDCRTAVKDETSLCHPRTLPGKLSAALGITIEEYESIAPEMEYAVAGEAALEGRFSAVHFADWLTPRGAESLASYEPWHMKRFAAATRHRFGKGWGYYVGTIFKEDAFYDLLIADVLAAGKVRPLSKPPEGVEISYRQGRGRRLMFVVNHTEEARTVSVPVGKTELISGKTVGPDLELGAYEVAVVKLR